jgi:hypothetical protein
VIADPASAACLASAIGLPDATTAVSEGGLRAITELTCDGQASAQGPIGSPAGIDRLRAAGVHVNGFPDHMSLTT